MSMMIFVSITAHTHTHVLIENLVIIVFITRVISVENSIEFISLFDMKAQVEYICICEVI